MIFTSALSSIEKIFHEKYILSSTIQHRGERGRQREGGLSAFLKENLPLAYGVATGEIVSFKGSEISPQCDVIIYDHLRMPILGRAESVQQIPIEAVYGVIECKSILDTAALRDAQEKFRKIRELPRCSPKTKLRKGMRRGPFYCLFGYRRQASVETCIKFVESSSVNQDIILLSLDSGCVVYLGGVPGWAYLTQPEKNMYHSLAIFYVVLLQSLKDTDLGNPSFLEMLGPV
jgi:hypothetical protein